MGEYRALVDNFVEQDGLNHMQLKDDAITTTMHSGRGGGGGSQVPRCYHHQQTRGEINSDAVNRKGMSRLTQEAEILHCVQ